MSEQTSTPAAAADANHTTSESETTSISQQPFSAYAQFVLHAHAGLTISSSSSPPTSSSSASSSSSTEELSHPPAAAASSDKGKCVVNAGKEPIEMGALLLLESPLLYIPSDFDSLHPCMEIELVYGENSEATTGVQATVHALRVMYAVVKMCAQPKINRRLFQQLHAPAFTPSSDTSASSSSSSSASLPLRTRNIISSLTHLDMEKLNTYIRSLSSTPSECEVATIDLLTQYILLYDTNAVQVAEDEEQQLQAGSAVYACFSRFNHDCDPNCFHSSTVHRPNLTSDSAASPSSPSSSTVINTGDNSRLPLRAVYATRQIAPNTELTISYLSQAAGEILYSTQYRRKILMLERLFFCRCTRCDSPDLARSFACPDAACKGMVTLQPKAVKQQQEATKAEGRPVTAVALPVDVDTRSAELNFSCSEGLCTHIWDEPAKASYVKLEQQVIRAYFQLDSTISQSDEPLVPINSLIRLASHNAHLADGGHWVLYELNKMKRDYFIQVGAQKVDILEMKIRQAGGKADAVLLEEREEDGKQEQVEATRLLEKELAYVRRVWSTSSSKQAPWPCTIFDARFSCAKLPSSPQMVLGEAKYTEGLVIEQLADAIRALRSEHIEYWPFVLYLYAYAFKTFKTCGGFSHLMTEGVKRKYAEVYKSLQQPKCANSQCPIKTAAGNTSLTANQEQKQDEGDIANKVAELAVDSSTASPHASAPTAATLLCSSCKLARYCSRACQEKHWKEEGHKQRCKVAASNGFTIVPKLE